MAEEKPLFREALTDSLLAKLPEAKSDTNHVRLLINLTQSYWWEPCELGIEYGLIGVELAKKINWKVGEVECLNAIAYNYTRCNSDEVKAREYYNKALKLSREINYQNGEAYCLTEIGLTYQNSDYPKALEYHYKSLQIYTELKDKKNQWNVLVKIAVNLKNLSEFDAAILKTKEALSICKEVGTIEDQLFIIFRIASFYNIIPNNQKANEYLEYANSLILELKDTDRINIFISILAEKYKEIRNYPKAIEYYLMSVDISKKLDDKQQLILKYMSIYEIYIDLKDYTKAKYYVDEIFKISKINSELPFEIISYHLLGEVSLYLEQYEEAIKWYNKSLELSIEQKEETFISGNMIYLGKTYTKMGQLDKALDLIQDGLSKMEKIKNRQTPENMAKSLLILAENYLAQAKLADSLLESNVTKKLRKELEQDVVNKYKKVLELSLIVEQKYDFFVNKNITLWVYQMPYEVYEYISLAYDKLNNKSKALEYYKKYIEAKESILNNDNYNKIVTFEYEREQDLKQVKIDEQEKREQLIVYSSVGALLSVLIILGVIFNQRRKSDKLLYNVLPVSIAKRLKKKEHPISDYFTQASIVFIDIVNFTEMASDADPQRLVEALNTIFTKYDTIANKYGLEKIKTIGDSYMAAAGIPKVQENNTHRAAQMALEVKAMMKDYHTADGTKIEVRIGLDCGPVVAGVIGENKFIYDMWSDAVNTASRMESSSIAGQVHVSERFKEAVTEYEEFGYVERGEIEIKGKGKMKTFFMGSKAVEAV